MQSRILVAAATAGIGILFAAPSVTATPITPIGSSAVTAAAELANGIEPVARRYYKRPRYGHRYPRYRHRYARRCWNCGGYGYGGYGYGGYGYGGYGPSVYFSLGIPLFYGGYYGSPYPYYGSYYRYPRYYRGYYRYPRYYGGYYGGSSVWYGGKRN